MFSKRTVKYTDDGSTPRICVVGGGIGGICQAIQLKRKLGLTSFCIYERAHDFGGVWLQNIYPGCTIDVPCVYYALSFELYPYFSNIYAPRDEVFRYITKTAKKWDLYPHAKFGTTVKNVCWNDNANVWKVTSKNEEDGEVETEFDFVIIATGCFREPNFPEQFQSFTGPMMHASYWDSTIRLENKVVGVVGCGSTAMQVVPEVGKLSKEMIVYIRRPPDVGPKTSLPFPSVIRFLFWLFPFLIWFLRACAFITFEVIASSYRTGSWLNRTWRFACNCWMKINIKDKRLYDAFTPKCKFGCQVYVASSSFYDTFNKPNCKVCTSKIVDIQDKTIVTEDGEKKQLDVLILCTGYKVQEYFAPMKVIGKDGIDVLKLWKESWPVTFYGMTCNSTPNLFFLTGPNSTLFTSHTYLIECQSLFIIKALTYMIQNSISTIQVKQSAAEEFLAVVKKKLEDKVWVTDAKDCTWVLNSRGECTYIWPDTPGAYWKRVKRFDPSKFSFKYRKTSMKGVEEQMELA